MKNSLLLVALLSFFGLSLKAQVKDIENAKKKYENYSFDTAADKISSVDRKSVSMRRILADSYLKTRDYALAEIELESIMASDDKNADDVFNYGQVLLMNKKYEQAQQSMQAYYELNPSDSRARAHYANPGYYDLLSEDKGQFKVTHLDINSEQEDFGPAYFRDKVVFASSRSGAKPIRRTWNWNRLPFLNMYIADSGSRASLGDIKQHHRKANKKYHEGPASFDASGEFMVFTRNNYSATDKEGVRRLKLFESSMSDGKWTSEKAFPFNSDEYSTGHAALTPDGKTMYLASDRPGGIGGVDLYVSRRTENGSWSEPRNLGEKINTEGNEMFPFIHHTGVLFFASDGLLGLGGLDVFATQLNSADTPGAIKNLGAPINTSRDDFSLIVDKDLKTGYFASDRESGSGDDDIYFFDVLKPITFGKRLEGIAKDKGGQALPNTEISLRDAQGNILESMSTDENGAYGFSVEPDLVYMLTGQRPEYFDGNADAHTRGDEDVFKVDVVLEKDPGLSLYGLVTDAKSGAPLEGVTVSLIDNLGGDPSDYTTPSSGDFRRPITDKRLKDDVSYNLILEKEGYLTKTVTYKKNLDRPGQYDVHSELDLSLTKLEVGMDIGTAININPIYFDVNKSNIRPDAAVELAKIVEVMNAYPTMIIELGSHTDCRASADYNRRLSDRRAKSSAAWIQKKISVASRIYGKGYGESQLVNDCACGFTDKNNEICSEEEHQLNRRTEFKIVKM